MFAWTTVVKWAPEEAAVTKAWAFASNSPQLCRDSAPGIGLFMTIIDDIISYWLKLSLQVTRPNFVAIPPLELVCLWQL